METTTPRSGGAALGRRSVRRAGRERPTHPVHQLDPDVQGARGHPPGRRGSAADHGRLRLLRPHRGRNTLAAPLARDDLDPRPSRRRCAGHHHRSWPRGPVAGRLHGGSAVCLPRRHVLPHVGDDHQSKGAPGDSVGVRRHGRLQGASGAVRLVSPPARHSQARVVHRARGVVFLRGLHPAGTRALAVQSARPASDRRHATAADCGGLRHGERSARGLADARRSDPDLRRGRVPQPARAQAHPGPGCGDPPALLRAVPAGVLEQDRHAGPAGEGGCLAGETQRPRCLVRRLPSPGERQSSS